MNSEAELLESLKDKTILGKRGEKSRYHREREVATKEHFVTMK